MTELSTPIAMTAGLGLPSSAELASFREDARNLVTEVILGGPEERIEDVVRALDGYTRLSHPATRAEVLKDALDAYGDVITPQDWTRVHKAFKEVVARKEKAGRRSAYQDGMTKVAEFSELVWVEAVAEDCLHGSYLYADGFGWMQYSGRLWKAVPVEAVMDTVRDFTARKATEILLANSHDPREIHKMLKAQFVFSVTRLCQGYDLLRVDGSDMDARPDLLNVLNGTVDLRTGELLAHSASHYFTKCAPTNYIPQATDAAWDQALSSMEGEVADWMQVRYGNGITGHTPDDGRMCFLNGTGGNGKSLHLNAICGALGSGKSGYFAALSEGALVGNGDKEALMSFRGTRLAIIEELPEGRQLNVTAVKRLVDTETLTGRHLYQRETTWTASHSLFVTSNYELNVNETDDGTWRRLVKCPFPYSYKDAEDVTSPHDRAKDYTLSARLGTQRAREACLAWLVTGAMRWYADGLRISRDPAQVKRVTEVWRGESDAIVRFFDEYLIPAEGHHVSAGDMLKAFNAVMADESQASWSQRTFTSRAKDHTRFKGQGIECKRTRAGQGLHPVASRRGAGEYHLAALPAQYMAFMGVRFRTAADDLDEMVEAAPIAPSGAASGPLLATFVETAMTGMSEPVAPVRGLPGNGFLGDGEYTYLPDPDSLISPEESVEISDPWTAGYVSDADWDTGL